MSADAIVSDRSRQTKRPDKVILRLDINDQLSIVIVIYALDM